MDDHPSRDELAALGSGTLTLEREGEILRHVFLLPCESCRSAVSASIAALFGSTAPELTAEQDAEYDEAIDRAMDTALWYERHLRRQEVEAEKGLRILERGGVEAPKNLPLKMGGLAKFKALRARSWSLRYEDPALMLQFARYAVEAAELLNVRTYGIEQVLDFRCEAQAELGNAFRLTEQLDLAEDALGRARELFELGTHSSVLEMRLLELEASLDADRRRFKDGIGRLDRVYQYYCEHHDSHLAGRALLKQGLYAGFAGDSDRALKLLEQSLSLIDSDRDPNLTYLALFNRALIFLDSCRHHEAEKQLFLLRPLKHHAGGRLNQLRFRWAEGRVDAGLQRLQRAEKTLREVREGFAAVPCGFDAALAGLDLAAVLLAQRKSYEAAVVVSESYETFTALRIKREALVTIVMLRTACQMGFAKRVLVDEVASFLRELENDPNVRFGGSEPLGEA